MRTSVSKWGNSLGIRIPLLLAEKAHIKDGTPVDLEINGEVIVIRRKTYTLEELLAEITPQNLHQEMNTGDSMGNEAW